MSLLALIALVPLVVPPPHIPDTLHYRRLMAGNPAGSQVVWMEGGSLATGGVAPEGQTGGRQWLSTRPPPHPSAEIIADEEQRLTGRLGQRVGEAVTEIEVGRVASNGLSLMKHVECFPKDGEELKGEFVGEAGIIFCKRCRGMELARAAGYVHSLQKPIRED